MTTSKTKRSPLAKILPWKGDSPSELIRKCIFIVSIIALLGCGIYFLNYFVLAGKATADSQKTIESLKIQEPTSSELEVAKEKSISEDYAKLYAVNNELVGWVKVPETRIDNAVVQATDNEKYLNLTLEGKKDNAGTVFADHRGPITKDSMPKNTILYGHNMKSGLFFADVHKYKDVNFYKTSPIVEFNTLYEKGQYKIFAIFFADPETDAAGKPTRGASEFELNYHNGYNFTDEAAFNIYVGEAQKRSLITTGVDVKYGDYLLTLSTCGSDSKDFSNSRLVLMARKVREGETADVDVSKAVKNDSVVMPEAWYQVHGKNAKP